MRSSCGPFEIFICILLFFHKIEHLYIYSKATDFPVISKKYAFYASMLHVEMIKTYGRNV